MPLLAILLCALLLAAPPASAAAGGRDRPTLGESLDALRRDGRISDAEYRERARTYRRVRGALRRLSGPPRRALAGALAQAAELAGRDRLDGRLTPVFVTLERNLAWYLDGRRGVPAAGTRRLFAGSDVVFQHYGHAGWQIQPLASYGRLNGLLTGRRPDVPRARRLADDLLDLAVRRAGQLASEYEFAWAGGPPGWVSGMTSATAVQSLARLWRATGDRRYLDAAGRMLFVFERPPPVGVRLERGGAGAHYLLYSQAPSLLVGNGFAQALIGLYDYAELTGDARGRGLYEDGLARARGTIARFDTGAWSLYWRRPGTRRGEESSLHYHRLFATFLDRLCGRTGEPAFCRLERRFDVYEKRPVRIGRLRTRTRGEVLTVRVWTSKRGSGHLTLRRGDRVVRARALLLARGTRVVRWRRPREPGSYRLVLSAESPTGLASRGERGLRLGR